MCGFRRNQRGFKHLLVPVVLCLLRSTAAPAASQAERPRATVEIDVDFPGGNAKVTKLEAGAAHVEPDLRGDRPWFYWCFEATTVTPGRMEFVFPETVAGFKNGGIGFQGPAVSTDGGNTWSWMGTNTVDGDRFYYDFKEPGDTVRFAVTIPYLEADLHRFLVANNDNKHLTKSVLTKSRDGRDVELLQIGKPTNRTQPVLVTARHHAAETIASFVLEGFLKEAMSETPEALEFRRNFVLFAVPFVDKDGVEEGDQGKNRKPHDHNRDYGENSIYPEVRAIKSLDERHDFRFALDFHCPTLVMQDHQVMYFVGSKQHPRYNLDNVKEFADWIKKGMPEGAPVGPLVWLRDETDPSPKNSRYFGFKKNAVMAATLEIPFAPPKKKMSPDDCRAYGLVILRAWVNTHFLGVDEDR